MHLQQQQWENTLNSSEKRDAKDSLNRMQNHKLNTIDID